MATGDIAAAAGLPVVPPTADIRDGYDAINALADGVGTHLLSGGHPWDKITGTPAISTSAAADTLAKRDASGQLTVKTTPTAAAHAASKSYVDAAAAANAVSSAAYSRNVGSSYYSMWMGGDLLIGRNVSSARYKDDITDPEVDLTAILDLRPRTFVRKSDPKAHREVGLIAEEVEEVAPWLVVHEGGLPEAVAYETTLPVALLAVAQAQQTQIAALKARLAALEGGA